MDNYVQYINQLLRQLHDSTSREKWPRLWTKHLLARSPDSKEQRHESVLHLGCQEAVGQQDEYTLALWGKALSDFDFQIEGWKSSYDSVFWQRQRAYGIVAAAQLALNTKLFRERATQRRGEHLRSLSHNLITQAWKVVRLWNATHGTPYPSNPSWLSTVSEQFEANFSPYARPEDHLNTLCQLLQTAAATAQPEVRCPLGAVQDLVRSFLGEPRRAMMITDTEGKLIPCEYHCRVVFVKKVAARPRRTGSAESSEEGIIAGLHFELLDEGNRELYADPFTLAFVREDTNFRATQDIVCTYLTNTLASWTSWTDVRWGFTHGFIPWTSDLHGGSLGAAFADGLCHLLSNIPGDLGVVVSAGIESDGKLIPVNEEGLEKKLEAVQNYGADKIKIHTVVVADGQMIPGVEYKELVKKAHYIADPERHSHRR